MDKRDSPHSMDAVVMINGGLNLVTAPIPTPGSGEVLVKVLATGICGSDLHCLAHTSELLASTKAATGIDLFKIDEPVVMGHEFCAEVVEYGPETRGTIPPGTRVASPGFLLREPVVLLGYGGPDIPGGYAEYMLLSEDLLIRVPDNVPDEIAALTEPMAVALHAVNRGDLSPDDVPLVIGCGPIGLAVIAILKMRGFGPIVAADFSPSRRAMATALGADVVVDPRETSPYESWKEVAATSDPTRMGPPNVMFPPGFRPSTVFECVGVPGIIQQILAGAAANSKVVVVGVCMEQDSFHPTVAILKEIDLIFSIAFSLEEYAEVLGHLASGALQAAPLITSRVGLHEVPEAFARLADPEKEAKIVVLPAAR
ncbi:zinc-binding dehydrogenase [Actinoallomurus sp. CA-150999]|uniref:zinc-binding dehydrogenase n=1 Tax=Actinoallomurus sp. CA-150999 TaxID=3239887 RepID=UPI003D8B3F67